MIEPLLKPFKLWEIELYKFEIRKIHFIIKKIIEKFVFKKTESAKWKINLFLMNIVLGLFKAQLL